MRALVFLLVAANLVFFAWAQGYLGERSSPDSVRLTQELAADRLRIVSRDQPPAPVAPPPKKVVEKCIAWAALAEADVAPVEALLTERFAELRRARHLIAEQSSWWVFIPPQANKAEADKKAAELKRLNVPEYFVVQDAGPNRFAISLGIFSSEPAAEERLEALKAKGVKSAKVAMRASSRPAQVVLEATGPENVVESAREAVAQAMPETKAAVCGKP